MTSVDSSTDSSSSDSSTSDRMSRILQQQRNRYNSDEAFRERKKEATKSYYKYRYDNDPEFKKKESERNKLKYANAKSKKQIII